MADVESACPMELARPMLSLRYRNLWILSSAALVLFVVWGSLQTSLHLSVPHGFDKIEHFSTYLFLAVWFTGLHHRPRYWRVALWLLGLGLSLEIVQYLMHSGRTGDPYDMAANTAGIAAGMFMGFLLTGGWAQRVETWLP